VDVVNIVVTGVGGQGLLTLARLLVESALAKGYDALAAETHGMSQRGGSVIVHVRIGKEVLAPTIPPGFADYILSTELMEAVRNCIYARKDTIVVVNTKIIYPALPGIVEHVSEDEVLKWLKQHIERLYPIPASSIAESLGAPQSTNMVILGAASALLKDYIDLGYLEKAVLKVGRGRLAELNLRAYLQGREIMCREYGVC